MTAKKADKFLDKHPEFAAKQCAERYPIIERIDTIEIDNKELLKAYEEEYGQMYAMIDSLINAKCDTVYRDKIIEIIKKIPGKPEIKYIIKTQESTAKLDAVQINCDRRLNALSQMLAGSNAELQKVNGKYDKAKKQRNWLLWLVIALIIYTFRKPIYKLIRPL